MKMFCFFSILMLCASVTKAMDESKKKPKVKISNVIFCVGSDKMSKFQQEQQESAVSSLPEEIKQQGVIKPISLKNFIDNAFKILPYNTSDVNVSSCWQATSEVRVGNFLIGKNPLKRTHAFDDLLPSRKKRRIE